MAVLVFPRDLPVSESKKYESVTDLHSGWIFKLFIYLRRCVNIINSIDGWQGKNVRNNDFICFEIVGTAHQKPIFNNYPFWRWNWIVTDGKHFVANPSTLRRGDVGRLSHKAGIITTLLKLFWSLLEGNNNRKGNCKKVRNKKKF